MSVSQGQVHSSSIDPHLSFHHPANRKKILLSSLRFQILHFSFHIQLESTVCDGRNGIFTVPSSENVNLSAALNAY